MQLVLKWAQTARFFGFDLFDLSNIVFRIFKSFERTKMSNHDQKSVISEFDLIIDFSAHSKTLEFFVELIFENISKSIMERKLSLNSLFTLPLKSPLPLSSHTIRF